MYKLIKDNQILGYSNVKMEILDTQCIEIDDNQYQEIETAKKRINDLKDLLASTDYQAIKFAEGELTAEEYEETKQQRKKWREEINKLELIINNQKDSL